MFSKVFDTVRAQLRARAQDDVLASLSNAALEDIGLTRADLEALRARSKPVRALPAVPEAVFANLNAPAFAHAA